MNRLYTYSFIVIGLVMLGLAARDERRGIANVYGPSRYSSISGMPRIVKREDNPKLFRSAMVYVWLRGSLFTGVGLFFVWLCRRADRTDPFSPHFAGNDALDELNRTLTAQQEQRDRPYRWPREK